jgi:hypothetical protein
MRALTGFWIKTNDIRQKGPVCRWATNSEKANWTHAGSNPVGVANGISRISLVLLGAIDDLHISTYSAHVFPMNEPSTAFGRVVFDSKQCKEMIG